VRADRRDRKVRLNRMEGVGDNGSLFFRSFLFVAGTHRMWWSPTRSACVLILLGRRVLAKGRSEGRCSSRALERGRLVSARGMKKTQNVVGLMAARFVLFVW